MTTRSEMERSRKGQEPRDASPDVEALRRLEALQPAYERLRADRGRRDVELRAVQRRGQLAPRFDRLRLDFRGSYKLIHGVGELALIAQHSTVKKVKICIIRSCFHQLCAQHHEHDNNAERLSNQSEPGDVAKRYQYRPRDIDAWRRETYSKGGRQHKLCRQ